MRADARIVDEHVDLAERGLGSGNARKDGCLIRDIDFHHMGAHVAKLGRGLCVAAFRVANGPGDVVSGLDKIGDDERSEPAVCGCDQNIHDGLSF